MLSKFATLLLVLSVGSFAALGCGGPAVKDKDKKVTDPHKDHVHTKDADAVKKAAEDAKKGIDAAADAATKAGEEAKKSVEDVSKKAAEVVEDAKKATEDAAKKALEKGEKGIEDAKKALDDATKDK
jgi:hypothetical protein